MTGAGSQAPGGYGNGNGTHLRRFEVKRTPHYWGCRNGFETRYPQAAEILNWLELRLRYDDPRDISRNVGGFTWITRTLTGETPDGDEIPAATVYFTLAAQTVVLQRLVADDETDEFP
jgi:hypothetical protein